MVAKDVARLWEELRHRDPEEKLGWITQLAQNPTEESIEVLLDVLQQESWFLRDQAARVLATMGEPVLGPLVEYLGSGLWYTRASAVTALGRMGNPRAAAPLVGMLNDPNRTVRDAVWDALLALCRNEPSRFTVPRGTLGSSRSSRRDRRLAARHRGRPRRRARARGRAFGPRGRDRERAGARDRRGGPRGRARRGGSDGCGPRHLARRD